MATGCPQLPGHPRSHSYGYPSNAPPVVNTLSPASYEGYIITPSKPRREDLSSQVRWTRARRTRSAATEKELENEINTGRHTELTVEEHLWTISETKRNQVLGLVESREIDNPGFTYHLVGLKLEPGYAHEQKSTRKNEDNYQDLKKRKKSTASMQIVLQRKSRQRQGVPPLVARASAQHVTGTPQSTARAGSIAGEFVPRVASGTHLNTSLPQYLPPHLRYDQEWVKETSSGPAAPAALSQASQLMQPRPPMTVAHRRESNIPQELYPLTSPSSSSLDSAESSPPKRTKSTVHHVSNTTLPTLRSGHGIVQPPRLSIAPPTPCPSALTFGTHLHNQITPVQANYQQSRSSQPRSEYPFPSVPPRSYVSSSTQTDISIPNPSPNNNGAIDKDLGRKIGKLPENEVKYTENIVGEDLTAGEDGIRVMEKLNDGYKSLAELLEKVHSTSTKHEKPAWMNNLVPVTPPAIAERFPGVPRRRSNPMSPIVEDAIDVSDSRTSAPKTCQMDNLGGSEHETDSSADNRADETGFESSIPKVNTPEPARNTDGGKDQGRAGLARRPPPVHGFMRHEKHENPDFKSLVPSLRTSGSYERPNPESRRVSDASSAEPEYFSLRPNDYAEDKPRSPNKRVTFSLPPSPLYGSASHSTSPGDTPPSSPHSRSESPIVKLPTLPHVEKSAARPPLPRQRSSFKHNPEKLVIIDSSVCRPPLHRQSQSSSSYSPRERSPPRAKNSNTAHLSPAPASFVDLEKHDREQRHGATKIRYEHVCPYASCKGLGFGLREDLKDHEYSVHRKAGRR